MGGIGPKKSEEVEHLDSRQEPKEEEADDVLGMMEVDSVVLYPTLCQDLMAAKIQASCA